MCAAGYVASQPATLPANSPIMSSGMAAGNIIYQPVTCLPCTSPCASCVNSPTTCLNCTSGFLLSGTTCVGQFNLAVSVTFSTQNNNNNFFNTNYYQIMTQLASTAQVNINAIVVTSITYASVVFNAQVTTTNDPSSSSFTSMQTNVQSFFSNLNITGLTVASSNIVNPNPPSNNTSSSSSSSNTTLIVAIVVPIVSVLIIATIVIIVCMRKRKENLKEMERKVQMDLSKDTEMSDRKMKKEVSKSNVSEKSTNKELVNVGKDNELN